MLKSTDATLNKQEITSGSRAIERDLVLPRMVVLQFGFISHWLVALMGAYPEPLLIEWA